MPESNELLLGPSLLNLYFNNNFRIKVPVFPGNKNSMKLNKSKNSINIGLKNVIVLEKLN